MDDKMRSDSTGTNKQSNAAKYKSINSAKQPLLVEKKDGSIGQWGNDLNSKTKTPAQIEADKAINSALRNGRPGPSEKSQGRSNTYY